MFRKFRISESFLGLFWAIFVCFSRAVFNIHGKLCHFFSRVGKKKLRKKTLSRGSRECRGIKGSRGIRRAGKAGGAVVAEGEKEQGEQSEQGEQGSRKSKICRG